MVPIDKNEYLKFLKEHPDRVLYHKALERTTPNHAIPDTDIYKELRFFSLMQIIRYSINKNLDGDFAECGCFQGHSSYIIAKCLSDAHADKKFHIFDSFEGLSKRDKQLDQSNSNRNDYSIRNELGRFACSEDEVKKNLCEFNFINFYKGWIPNRFKEVKDINFCFVHIDVDLYQPTYDALSFFYERLVEGGAIVIDDYGSSTYQGAENAVTEFLRDKKDYFLYEVPMGSAFIIKEKIK